MTCFHWLEMFCKLLDEGHAGEKIGALLRGTKREDIERKC